MKVVFNPDYYLRHDIKRTFIIQKKSFNKSSYGWYSVLHPLHAMIFSFFANNEPYNIVIEKLSEFLDMKNDEVIALIEPFIENNEDVYVSSNNIDFDIPRNVLIKSEMDIVYDYQYSPENFICVENDFTTKRYLKAPLNLTIMPNNTCITDCIYCYADKNHVVKNHLSFERIIEILDEAKSLQCVNVGVVGGDIFVYPKWKELLKAIKHRNFELSMLSTKVPLTMDDIKYIKELGVEEIQISLDSINFEELKVLVKSDEKYYTNIKTTLKILKEEGFNVQIATIITKYNSSIESISNLYKFINDLNINSWSISPGFESLYRQEQSFRAKKEDIYNLINYIEIIQENSKTVITFDKTYLERNYGKYEGGSQNFTGATCSALCSHIFILPDGKVTICEQLYFNPHFIIGDLTTQSIVEVWNSEKANWFLNLQKEDLKPENPCSKCDIFDNCYQNMNRCWADVVKAYGNNNWDYPDPRCSLAPIMKNNLEYV